MLIEFLGMPGVGKTTLARTLVEDLQRHGYRAVLVAMDTPPEGNRYARLFHHLREIMPYLLWNPRQAWHSVLLARHFPQRGWIATLSRLRYQLRMTALAWHGQRRADVVVLDQGHFQGLFAWALFCREANPAIPTAALQTTLRPELVVLVTASEDTVRARLRQRNLPHRRIDRLLLGDERWLAASFRLVSQIEQAVCASGCPMLRVSSEHDTGAATLSRRVLAALAGRMPPGRAERGRAA